MKQSHCVCDTTYLLKGPKGSGRECNGTAGTVAFQQRIWDVTVILAVWQLDD